MRERMLWFLAAYITVLASGCYCPHHRRECEQSQPVYVAPQPVR
jgi:hypothetical protein